MWPRPEGPQPNCTPGRAGTLLGPTTGLSYTEGWGGGGGECEGVSHTAEIFLLPPEFIRKKDRLNEQAPADALFPYSLRVVIYSSLRAFKYGAILDSSSPVGQQLTIAAHSVLTDEFASPSLLAAKYIITILEKQKRGYTQSVAALPNAFHFCLCVCLCVCSLIGASDTHLWTPPPQKIGCVVGQPTSSWCNYPETAD